MRCLLARLVVRAGDVVSEDALLDALWADGPPNSARTALQTHVGALRDLLEPDRPRRTPGRFVATHDDGYVLDVDEGEVDLLAVEAHVAEAARLAETDPAAALARVDAALDMWDEPPLGEWSSSPWAQGTVARLERQHERALDLRADVALRLGRHDELVPFLERAVARHPYHERLVAHLMIALWRSDRQRDALAACDAARRRLADDLGVDPGPRLAATEAAILRHDRSLLIGAEPSTAPAEEIDTSTTRFVGRERELAELVDLLPRRRLVTLVGPGGVGKSRLARRGAARVDAPGGVIVVDLAPVAPGAAERALAERLGIDEHHLLDRDAVEAALRGPDRLILLDTCERVLDEAARLADRILDIASCSVLATSRSPLGHADEHVLPIEPLPDDDAVALLLDRSGVEASADDLLEVCRRLDGLPLALELAAGRLRTLTPAELGRLIDRSRASLRGGADRPARHRDLLEMIRWSHDLLDDRQRELLQVLAVPPGSFDVDLVVRLAPAVGIDRDDAIGGLVDLVDRSLISRVDRAGQRFRMLDTVRDFVVAEMGEERLTELRTRHADWVRHVALGAVLGTGDIAPVDVADEVGGALDHLHATGDPAELDVLAALGSFWMEVGRVTEGRRRLDAALARWPDAPPLPHAVAQSTYALLAWFQGDGAGHRDHVDRALARVDEVPLPGFADLTRACDHFVSRRLDDAETTVSRALGLMTSPTRPRLLALYFAGNIAWYRGESEAAVARYEEQRALASELDDRFAEAQATAYAGMARAEIGQIDRGWALAERGLRLARACGDDVSHAQALGCLALVAHRADDVNACSEYVEPLLAVSRRQVDAFALRVALPLAAWTALDAGDHERAVVASGFLHQLLSEGRLFLPPVLEQVVIETDAATDAALGAAAARRARAGAAAHSLAELVDVLTRSA
ncbi:MAG: BTAD domain-containing putative transcriptional regulator [Actinomycetota bacterium]